MFVPYHCCIVCFFSLLRWEERQSNIRRSRRQSTRVSKSPYARRGQPVRTEPERPRQVEGQGKNRVQGNQVDNVDIASEQLVGNVIPSLVPELRGELIETIRSIRNSDTSEQGHSDMRGIHKESDQSDSVIVINNQALCTNAEPMAINSVYDNLGVHVTKQLRGKIINGEYIDLGCLLEKSSTDQGNMLEVNASGQLVVKQKVGKIITDISSWLDAFLDSQVYIFMLTQIARKGC